ncbi:MAG: hypothetical protein IPK64_14545 [bacterium]|nr:hypothetical protein [bacterium]
MPTGRPTWPHPRPVTPLLLFAVALLAAAGVITAATAAPAADTRLAVPEDAARLVPPGAALVVALSSLAAAEIEWQALAEAFGSAPGSRDHSLLSAFGDGLPGFADVVADDRPLLVAVGLTGLVMGGSPDLTFVFPFRGDLARLQYGGPGSPFVNLQQSGSYAALSSSPLLRPLDRPTALPLPDGLLAATVDLGLALKLGLPLLETGMDQLATPRPDSTGALQAALLTVADAEAVKVSLRTVARCVTRLDLAMRRVDDRWETMDRLHIVLGSELSPGPQPSFDQAARLTALLPPGADLVQVAAMDLTRPFAVFEPIYLSDMKRTAALLDPADARAYEAWYADYLGLVPLTARPVAAGLHVTEAGAFVHAVLAARDGKAAFARVTGLLDRLSALPVPVQLEPLADDGFPGADVRAYRVKLDAPALLAPVPGAAAAVPQVAQVSGLFSRLVPEIRLARVGDTLLASADPDRRTLGAMIAACRDEAGRGPVDPRPAAAAAAGDGHVQEVIAGDLTSLWRWFSGLAGNLEGSAALPGANALGPLPCHLTMSAWDGGLAGTFSVRRDDLLSLARALTVGAPAPR